MTSAPNNSASSLSSHCYGSPVTRDTEYYFSNVVFQVGKTIFCVPRAWFELPGTAFEAMFSLPQGLDPDAVIEGTNETNPIILPVNEDHFRGFLRALCPFNGRLMTDDDWLGALELSTMWIFPDVRARAIIALSNIRWPVAKWTGAKEAILFAKKYRVLSWLKEAYAMVFHKKTMSIDEFAAEPALDWETIARLSYVRNLVLSTRLQYSVPGMCYGGCNRFLGNREVCFCQGVTQRLIEHAFKQEFRDMADEAP